MRDKRPVDELSIEELERVLAIKRREQRLQTMTRMRQSGRVVETPSVPSVTPGIVSAAAPTPASPAASRPARIVETERPAASAVPTPARAVVEFDDDIPEVSPPPADPAKTAAKRGILNRGLLFVEVAAVLGLVLIGANLLGAVGTLERETASAQQQAELIRRAGIPTPEPTSILSVRLEDFVLPGGHVVEADGSVRFNLDEFIDDVPSHLQTAVQNEVITQLSQFDIRRPTQTDETALFVNIPALGIDQSIKQGTDWAALKEGVGQVLNGATPGSSTGNIVLAAHNDIYGELFKDLDQLQVGDEFYIQTRSRTYTYRVTGFEIVDPTDVHVMSSLGRPTATLISCYPYRVNNKRYVVFAERLEVPGV
jgi:sortase A